MQRESLKYYTIRDKRAGREGKKGEDGEREKMRPPPLRAKEEGLIAHRVYDGGRGSDRPRTLIFRVLRWHYRSEILKGARQAYR